MKIIQPSVQILSNINGSDILKHLEMCGRVCYKSEDKITDDSCKKFIKGIIDRGHEAVLEHGSYIVMMKESVYNSFIAVLNNLAENGYNVYLRTSSIDGRNIISGNVRAWRDFIRYCFSYLGYLPGWIISIFCSNDVDKKILFEDLLNRYSGGNIVSNNIRIIDKEDLTDEEKIIHYDVTVKIVCDRGVTHEIVRHRPVSYCQESTRYCNYTKDKFGNEITVIEPCFFERDSREYFIWERNMECCEKAYFDLLDCGCTPQQARDVLPNSLKTEIVMTANIGEWRHFLKLRCSKAAHPQMIEVACKVLTEFHLNIPVLFDYIWEEVYG